MSVEFGLIMAPGYRSRAYAQILVANGMLPAIALRQPGNEPDWDGPAEIRVRLREGGSETCFRPGEPAWRTLEDAAVPIHDLPDSDINTPPCAAAMAATEPEVLVYSGSGGVLLSAEILACGKRFLHIHGGFAPAYRGSTAFYYSLLDEGTMGATAIQLDPGIDTGAILARRRYPAPRGTEIDRIMDPLIRADLLAEVIATARSQGAFPEGSHDDSPATTYFVIHPTLKHIALRRCGLTSRGG